MEAFRDDEMAAHLAFAVAHPDAPDADAPAVTMSRSAMKKAAKAAKRGGGAAAGAKKAGAAPAAKAAKAAKAGAAPKKKKKELAKFEFTNPTPPGEKKDITTEMLAAYQPLSVESAWAEWWEASGFFQPDMDKAADPEAERFVVVLPPPNVTGSLHLGHALTCAVEDCMVRWHRMQGHVTLWVPGTDHAGIATQSVVEKKIAKDEGLSRHDLGREAFVERVWQWKEEYGSRITRQLRKLGASLDWSREAFTMDGNLQTAVREAFVRMHRDGIIYRSTRLVNWSCRLMSAISDIEVDRVELTGRTMMHVPGHDPARKYEFGVITSFAYKVKGSDEEIVVATTRLETMLGDVAVAVHPQDPRYTHLHGAELEHPFVPDRRVVVITDDILVDMAFGTGAVKITPAHDPNDFACGKRNDMPEINILTDEGTINANGGEFAGMMRYDARVAIQARLEELGLYRGKADNAMSLGVCSRSKDIIEPMLKPQWWVSCANMAKRATDAVRNGELQLLPAMHEHTWFNWLDNIQDWCISRQLWWGHRIPAYLVLIDGQPAGAALGQESESGDPRNDNCNWVVGDTEADALAKAVETFGVEASRIELQQDPDVLDTWFSSGLFPFSVFNWPEDTADLRNFFPTQLLETGHDILFFWVARMVMMSLHLTDRLPFTKVYMHAMVRDKYGRKMSKSLGNVIDPLEVINGCTMDDLLAKIDAGNLPPKEIEKAKAGQRKDFPDGIPECGTDALRFGLLAYTIQGRDVNLDIDRVLGYRQFCNKLWNAMRFALNILGDDYSPVPLASLPESGLSRRERWILSRTAATVQACDDAFNAYVFGELVDCLHKFFLNDFCDAYLEFVKPAVYLAEDASDADRAARLNAQHALFHVLDACLRLFHPLMPYVTEELWQRLPGAKSTPSIMLAPYPQPAEWGAFADAQLDADMATVRDVIHGARGMRAEYGVKPSAKPDFFIWTDQAEDHAMLAQHTSDFMSLAKGGELTLLLNEAAPNACGVAVVSANIQVYMNLVGLLDVEKEIAKLEKTLGKATQAVADLEKRMSIEGYETRVKEHIREKNAAAIAAARDEIVNTSAAIARFEALRQ